jgi:hypothetical protein
MGAHPSLPRLRRVAPQPRRRCDNPLLLVRLAVKPLAQPPFPLEFLSHI